MNWTRFAKRSRVFMLNVARSVFILELLRTLPPMRLLHGCRLPPNRRISLSQTSSRDTEPDVVVDSLFPSMCARVEKFSERMMLAAPES